MTSNHYSETPDHVRGDRSAEPDLIIVGAGLSGLLTAWRCLEVNQDLRVTIIETSDRIAGDHTWSFNLTDIPEFLRDWIKPFIAHQWPRYDVRFPKYARTLEIPYCTGNSDTLRACVQPFIDEGRLKVLIKTKVEAVDLDHITLESGEKLNARCVLDARGFEPNDNVFLGFQKFVGQTVRTKEPHGLEYPIIMDATVDQLGGYRFVYCLPFSETEILVEDTYYTDAATLSENEVVSRIEDYITEQGWQVDEVIRQEKGVLPITLAVDPTRSAGRILKLGIAGGHYHAVTGYSFPNAVKLAEIVAQNLDSIPLELSANHYRHIFSERFFRLLNRMLFRAAKPEDRYKVLQRFYRLNPGLIERFYAGELRWYDKLRILVGKPPVPLHLALYNLSEKAFIKRERKKRASGHE